MNVCLFVTCVIHISLRNTALCFPTPSVCLFPHTHLITDGVRMAIQISSFFGIVPSFSLSEYKSCRVMHSASASSLGYATVKSVLSGDTVILMGNASVSAHRILHL